MAEKTFAHLLSRKSEKLAGVNRQRVYSALWGAITLLYFGVTWGGVQFLARDPLERLIAAFIPTLIYALVALAFARSLLRRVTAANQALEENLFRQLEIEAQLRQELMERTQTEETLRRINAELDALNATTASLLNSLNTPGLLEEILQRAAVLMKTPHGFLFVVEPAAQELVLRVGIGRYAEYIGYRLKRGQGMAGMVWKTGEPMVVSDYSQWEQRQPGFEWARAQVCLPLRVELEIVGVIGVVYVDPDRQFGQAEIDLLHRFGQMASLALANARLYEETQRELAERRRAEQRLQEMLAEIERAQTKARAILDAATDSMLLLAPDQTILLVNRSFCEHFFGGTPRQIVGKSLDDYRSTLQRLFDPADAFDHIVHTTLTDTTAPSTHDLIQITPRRRELHLASTPVRTAMHEYLGRLYVFRDVTREREIDRMKSEFVSMVSHELRTPLTSIKGYVDLLQADQVGTLNATQREFLNIVKANTDRLVQLINDLLDLSRIEARRIELQRQPLDLPRLVEGVVATLQPQLRAKQQELLLDLPPDLPPAWGDPDRVIQILTNLVSNAHKYTPAAGKITITARAQEAWVRVDVADTGIGLSREDQARLFSRFFRASSAARDVPGTGLGLAITRSLVELHGGDIWVESAPGQGSTFSFTLPVVPQVNS